MLPIIAVKRDTISKDRTVTNKLDSNQPNLYATFQKAFAIYSDSPTQENIRGTEFGLWQAVVEYADHYSQKDASIATLAGRNDGIKLRALELIGI